MHAATLKAIVAIAFAILYSAGCGARAANERPWIDVAASEGDGVLLLENASEATITRLWLLPSRGSHEDAYSPQEFVALPQQGSFQASIPMGWWDLWLERADGADVVLVQAWFGSEQITRFVVEDSWWQLGDWIQESDLVAPSPAP